jgi:hypothetical protein
LTVAAAAFALIQVQKSSFSVKSNFFELGGNSLRAGLINSKIRRATGADISGGRLPQQP